MTDKEKIDLLIDALKNALCIIKRMADQHSGLMESLGLPSKVEEYTDAYISECSELISKVKGVDQNENDN